MLRKLQLNVLRSDCYFMPTLEVEVGWVGMGPEPLKRVRKPCCCNSVVYCKHTVCIFQSAPFISDQESAAVKVEIVTVKASAAGTICLIKVMSLLCGWCAC